MTTEKVNELSDAISMSEHQIGAKKIGGGKLVKLHECQRETTKHSKGEIDLNQGETNNNQDHIFVSYAGEDIAFVEWLVYKLTVFGYKVWCDGIKIFGGESYPKDIDEAIKNRAYRFLAVMSKYSVNKPNPVKERTIAHSISKERQVNFIIPLNLGLEPTELDWMMSDLTFVDFSTNWAEGLAKLLKALKKADTPCTFKEGKNSIENSIISGEIIRDGPEVIYSNFLKIKKIPKAITAISFKEKLSSQQYDEVRNKWACRRLDARTFLAFHLPPDDYSYIVKNAYLWKDNENIEGVNAQNVILELLKKCLYVICFKKGLVWSYDHRWLYFPYDSGCTNRISFVDSNGRNNNIQIAGERTYFIPGKPERYRYHLSPTFRIFTNMFEQDFIVRLGMRVRVTKTSGRPLRGITANSRRKHATKDWWNYEWVSRYLALCDFISGREPQIVLGEQEQYKLIFESRPVSYESKVSLNENIIDERMRIRKSILSKNEEN